MSDWTIHKLDALCSKITVGHVGSMTPHYREKGVLFLRSLNIKRGNIDLTSVKYISDEFNNKLKKTQLQAGDIAIVRTGEPGNAAVIPENLGPANCSDIIIVRANPEVNEKFLCYAINETARDFIRAHTVGAVQQHFNVASAKNLPINVPSALEQKCIATVLCALDEKISTNERILEQIEELLRNVHKSFASRTEAQPISSIAQNIRAPYKSDESSELVPYIGLEHMPRKSIWLTRWETSQKITSTKGWFQKGDILFGKLRPYFHKVGLAQTKGICSTDILVIRASQEHYRPWLLMSLSSEEVVEHATARSEGTRMPRAKWPDVASFEVPLPSSEEAGRFYDVAEPLIQRAEEASAESRTLAELRDTLLPQLMSGKLRVKDAEKIVEDNV